MSTADIQPPAGATVESDWDVWDGECRIVVGRTRLVGDVAEICTSAQQNRNGEIETGGHDFPRVVMERHARDRGWTADEARQVAALLIEAAGELDNWTRPQSARNTCGHSWCCSDHERGAFEHWGEGSTTANYRGPKSAEISAVAWVTTGAGEPYHDEIYLHAKAIPGTGDEDITHAETIDDGIGLFLTVDEALELRALIDKAIADRAEIRGDRR
jgi:hypothetical protein